MRKFFFILLAFLSFSAPSQNRRNYQKILDSINQKKWDSAALDLDSLANPKIIDLDAHYKDTIIIRDKVVVPSLTENIPITPFNLLKLKQPKHWYLFGQNNLIFNEAAFSNWNSGGNNNFGVIGKLNYNLSYKNRKHFLENNFQLAYGTVAYKGQSSRKTDDYINIMTNYGYDLGGNYYLSTGFQFLSQFTAGYNYAETPDPTYGDRVSRFMAPGYLNAGLGISYNPNENFQAIFRPLTGKFTFVTDPLLQVAGRYGLERDGQSVRSELGSMLNIQYRMNIYKGMDFTSQLNFFSNYLFHIERVDINYNGVLNIRFNKFISTVVGLDLIYDHDQVQKLQLKQTLGVAFSYNVGADSSEREKVKPKKIIKPFIVN